MDVILPLSLAAVAGLVVALGLTLVWHRLVLPWPANGVIGAVGGVMASALKGHVLGGHHHTAGMTMPTATDPSALAASAAAGCLGAALMVALAGLILWLAPNR